MRLIKIFMAISCTEEIPPSLMEKWQFAQDVFKEAIDTTRLNWQISDHLCVEIITSNLLSCTNRVNELYRSTIWGRNITDEWEKYLQAVRIVVADRGINFAELCDGITPFEPTIVILGQTVIAEHVAYYLSTKHLTPKPVIVRFSIFYPKPSTHTGISPQKAGYDLDCPKNLACLDALLSNEEFLLAAKEKNWPGIMKAVATLNKLLIFASRPIIDLRKN